MGSLYYHTNKFDDVKERDGRWALYYRASKFGDVKKKRGEEKETWLLCMTLSVY